jgi:cellulose synthase/poly-beta-1,6-N-acetylglucosamine synthase-like glycosyltransferase
LFLLLYLERGDYGKAKLIKKYPSVSIIVPVYNSIKTIGKCMAAIKKIKYPKKIEIIVVDDGSTDGSREYLEKLKGIKLIKLKKNSGKAIALNKGLEFVKTDFVACIDSDTYPENDVLLKTMGYFEDARVGAVTGLILPDKVQSLIQRLQFFEYAIGFGFWTTILSSINSMTMIPGPLTVFRKKAFDEIGGYDPGNLTEDMEIALRLQKHSYKIMVCFEAKAFTDIPDTWKKLFKQRDRWYRGRIFNLIKYKSLFFNKKNSDLGFFALPYLFALEISSVLLLFRTIVLFANTVFNFFAIETTVFGLTNSFGFFVKEIIVPSTAIFFVFSYLLILLFTYFSLKLIGYKTKNFDWLVILINILLYPFFVSTVYFQSYLKEMAGVKSKWVRVST